MNDFESIFRRVIYIEYGVSPEQLAQQMSDHIADNIHDARVRTLSTLTGCSVQQIERSHFLMSISEFLIRFHSDIINSGKSEGIDATAIAAAITWEFHKNLKGRLSDYVQTNPLYQLTNHAEGAGVGWGSMHAEEAVSLSGKNAIMEVSCIRMDAQTVIPLVAQFMKKCVDTYFKESGSIYIGNDPVLLAYFYNTGIRKAEESARKRKNEVPDIPNSSQVIHLNVTVNPMAKWVKSNLNQFTKFYTAPSVPNGVKAYAIAK